MGSYKTQWYQAGRLDVHYHQCESDYLKETQEEDDQRNVCLYSNPVTSVF